jgi:transcriptional regulator with XRE-family HTH domain
MIVIVDDLRVGRALRALRLRRGWRQADLAVAAGLSQSTISLVERGHWTRLSVSAVRTAFAALDARLDGAVSWRGGALDHLLDEGHAALVGEFGGRLRRERWTIEIEATYSIFGERGSIDILAGHESSCAALVVEVKTEIASVEETIRRLDAKVRLASAIATERFGWRPRVVARLLVVRDGSTSRRRIERQRAVFDAAFPDRGDSVRAWLREPSARLSGLVFMSATNPRGTRRPVAGRAGYSRARAPKGLTTDRPGS